MNIKDSIWEVFQGYLEQTVDFFESIEPQDFETATLREQLQSILDYQPEGDNGNTGQK